MGSVQDNDSEVWIRCWDGTEMEYECFSKAEMRAEKNDGLSAIDAASRIGAVRDMEFEKMYNKL